MKKKYNGEITMSVTATSSLSVRSSIYEGRLYLTGNITVSTTHAVSGASSVSLRVTEKSELHSIERED